MKPQKVFLSEEALVLALKNQQVIGMQALHDMYSDSLRGVISRILRNNELVRTFYKKFS